MNWLARSGIAAVVLCASLGATALADRPNVWILLFDDLGYGEMGCEGNSQIPTPQLGSLARNGIRFMDPLPKSCTRSSTSAPWQPSEGPTE